MVFSSTVEGSGVLSFMASVPLKIPVEMKVNTLSMIFGLPSNYTCADHFSSYPKLKSAK